MKRFQVLPCAALRPYIDRIWGWDYRGGAALPLPALLPGTGAELYFHYRQPFSYTRGDGPPLACETGHLFCLRRDPLQLSAARDLGFIAVRFKAGMLHRFTAIPGRELADRVLALDDLWERPGQALQRRLSYAATPAQCILLIEDFLCAQLRSDGPDAVVERAMEMLYRDGATLTIQQLAERLHLGRRQLERRFLSVSGQTPAAMKSLARFQHTVRALMLDAAAAATDVALAQGYFDQAHFIRNFRRYAGAAPQCYLQGARNKTHFYNTSRDDSGIMPAPDHYF
ncbi:MAG: AraC family transcriptional regulator [Burkholderiales bacterium]|nr:AraC family transcriptional regulator [Burkholderiales bacterium]